jgi:retron-type reverse transcriptase
LKTHKELFPLVCSFPNLLLAYRKARTGKRTRTDAARFEIGLEHEILRLQEELSALSYVPGPYRSFHVYEPKKRLISAAPFRDRVVHHALCNIIEPLFERTFIYDSYANRIGKGTHRAILRYQHWCRLNRYVLKCDIRKFFPSIDHDILKHLVRRKISCRKTLWLIDTIIDHSNAQEQVLEYYDGDTLFSPLERRKGLPIGNLTSQFFANVYLNPLDHFIKERLRCRFYLRYVDDFLLLSDDKHELKHWKDEIENVLGELRLTVHENKTMAFPVAEGIEFLGHRVFPSFRLLKKPNVVRFKRRLKFLQAEYLHGRINLQKLHERLQSWIAHASFSDTHRLRTKLFDNALFVRA